MIQQYYNELKSKVPNTTKTLKEFTKEAMNLPIFSKQVIANEEALQEVESKIKTFDAETKTLIDTAIQTRLEDLQEELKKSKIIYQGSEAEANDKKVLLELGLQDNINNPDQLFSEQNIQQVLATYGLQEGLERLQQLRTESNDAREEAAKAEIQTDIFQNSYDYQNNPDLAQALNKDIEAKLQTLKTEYPNSETISEALSRDGTDRLRYLINSGDSQLQQLAFWFSKGRGDKTEAEILSEHPNFAQYVEQQTEGRYAKQKQQVVAGEIGGRSYLDSEADRQLQQDIDIRIDNEFTRAKTDKLQALQTELTNLQSDENGYTFDSLDQSMSADRDKLERGKDKINNFQAELAQAIQDGRVKFEKGTFSSAEDIPNKNQGINRELEKLQTDIKSLIQNNDQIPLDLRQRLQNLDIEQKSQKINDEINRIRSRRRFKWFGIGNNEAAALESLAGEVSRAMEQYNQLQTEKQSNETKSQESRDSQANLQQAYNKLPKYIQDKLSALENPSLETITQAITSGVEEIQNYQTPPEITEKREQISALETQIAKTKDIKIPTTQATT